MSLVTTCPACETTFRVTPEQLSAYRGDVRCGQCQHIFSALQKLEEVAGAESALPAKSVFSASGGEVDRWSVLPPPDAPNRETATLEVADEPDGNAFEDTVIVSLPENVVLEPEEIQFSLPLQEEVPQDVTLSALEELPESSLEAGAPVDFELEFPADDPRALTTEPPAEAEGDVQESAPRAETFSVAVMPLVNEQPETSQPATQAPPPFVPSFLQQAPKRGISLWLAVPLALLLLMTATGQVAYFMRTEIAAQYPPARLWLELACARLSCRVELPRQVDLLNIEDSDLLDDAEHNGALVLVSALYNRASYTQAYPLLELTLTDTFDKPVLRRTFEPQDYLPAGTDIKAGISGGGEVHSRLALSVEGEKPAGYRLFVRY